MFCSPTLGEVHISERRYPVEVNTKQASTPLPPDSRRGRPVGVGRPLRNKGKRKLLSGDEGVLAFFFRLFVHPNNRALAFTVELGFHGALLRFIHRAHVI